jgi:NAD(P)-dependent dehydrogenase (short-subunit alcohol dehydrogenase family)
MNFKDNVTIVTGGASGLGAATVRLIAGQGGKVVIADLQTELGEA